MSERSFLDSNVLVYTDDESCGQLGARRPEDVYLPDGAFGNRQ